MDDTVDKLVIFLAKRDGIDKLVKTFQYVSKLIHWQTDPVNSAVAERAKKLEVASGISRKAFRTGRFLNGFNTLRRSRPGQTPFFQVLAILGNGGEMVYFFFDHLLWLSRVGVLDPNIASRMSFVSAFGEGIGYVFFIIADLIVTKSLILEMKRKSCDGEEEEVKKRRRKIKGEVVMRLMAIAANLADLVIAVAEVQPNPFCNHAVTLGVSGLVSAWAGWYRNWPSS